VSLLVAVIVNIAAALVLALLVTITQAFDKLIVLRKRKIRSHAGQALTPQMKLDNPL